MVRFQHEGMRRPHPLEDEFRGVTEIREESDISLVCPQQETHRIHRVVRDREGVDANVANGEFRPGFEQGEVQSYPGEILRDGIAGQPVAVDGNPGLGAESAEPADVVAVFVGDEDAVEPLGRASDAREALADLFRTEPGIDEQSGLDRKSTRLNSSHT